MEVRTCVDGLDAAIDRLLNLTRHVTATARREDESDLPQADILKATIAKLDESLKAHDVQKLQFTLLNGLLKVRAALVGGVAVEVATTITNGHVS